jgi:tetratricopeptide (TPR) repeat protein
MTNKLLFCIFLVVLASCGNKSDKVSVDSKLSLDELIQKYPDSIALLNKRADLKLSGFQYEAALKDAAHAFRLDSSDVKSRLLYAEALLNKKDLEILDLSMAQYHFGKVLEKNAKNLRALLGMANIMSIRGDNESAFLLINKALRINPKYRDAYVLKGSIYRNEGNLGLAKSSYETAVQQDPKFFGGYLMLGSLYESEGDPICIEYYITARKLQPKNVDVLYSLAYAKHEFGHIAESKSLYRKMAKMDTSYFEAFFQLGHIKQFDDLDLDSAMYFYSMALDIFPQHIESLHNLGLIYEDKKQFSNALLSYGKVLKYNPDFQLTLDRVAAIKNKK